MHDREPMSEDAPDTLRQSADRVALWRRRPEVQVYDLWPQMEGRLDGWQVDGLQYCGSDRRNKRLMMSASAGVGKTAELAWLIINRLTCYARPNEHPKGAALSMDAKNLAANLVPELTRWVKGSAMLDAEFEITADRIRSRRYPGTWFCDFRAWPKKANASELGDTLAGLHSPWPFAILDECASIPVPVLRSAQQIETTCEDSLIAGAGNPRNRDGSLYQAIVREPEDWHCIRITSDPDDPDRCSRVDKAWAQARIDKLGRDDPWVQIFILGRFPDSAINTLLTEDDVLAAMDRHPLEREYAWAPLILGVDVAREGLDYSVCYARQHTMAWRLFRERVRDGVAGAALTATHWTERRATACFIDNTGGWGASWYDQLRALNYAPVGVIYSGKPIDPRFYNKRAENWWLMAEAIKNGNLALPKGCSELLRELPEVTYTYKSDRILLEPKDSVSDRLGHSPDDSDALSQTWAYPVAARLDPVQELYRSRQAQTAQYVETRIKRRP